MNLFRAAGLRGRVPDGFILRARDMRDIAPDQLLRQIRANLPRDIPGLPGQVIGHAGTHSRHAALLAPFGAGFSLVEDIPVLCVECQTHIAPSIRPPIIPSMLIFMTVRA